MGITHRRGRARAARLAVATVLAVLASTSTAGSAPAQQPPLQYGVSVRASAVYTRGPSYEPVFSPALPPGYGYVGSVRCRDLVVDGAQQRIADVSFLLQVGEYEMRNCTATGLQVVDANGDPQPAALTITGGTYRVAPGQTELDIDVTNAGDGRIIVVGVVVDIENEDSSVGGAQVRFSYENASGFWVLDACTFVTDPIDPAAPWRAAVGGCEVPSAAVLAGTGRWTAEYAPTRNHRGSSAHGVIDGALTTAAQAAMNFVQGFESVEIVADYRAPGCYVEPQPNSAGLFAISVSVLSENCSALRAFQITAEVVLSLLPGETALGGVVIKLVAKRAGRFADKAVKQFDLLQATAPAGTR